MPTDEQIEAAAKAIYESLYPVICGIDGVWHPEFGDLLAGQDKYLVAAKKALEATEKDKDR